MKLNILCLYHDIMNLYGDTGNIKVLKYHLDELNIKYSIDYLGIDDELSLDRYDLIMIGSGTEDNRKIVLNHLKKYKKEIKEQDQCLVRNYIMKKLLKYLILKL